VRRDDPHQALPLMRVVSHQAQAEDGQTL